MRKIATFIGVFALLSSIALAQAYRGKSRLRGFVYDEQGKPLEGVEVKLYCVKAAAGFTTKTDKKGEWKAFWIRGGRWDIDFYKPGYEVKKISVYLKEGERKPPIEIKLKKIKGLVITPELEGLLVEGNKLFKQGKYKEALEKFQEIIKQFPDAYPIYINIGNCYFQMNQYDRAIEAYKKVLQKDKNNIRAFIAIGNAYLNKGNTEEAMKWYGKIEMDKIDDPTVLYNLGTIYYNNAKYDLALKYYEKCVELNPKDLDGLYQLGLTYTALMKFDKALEVFKKYLELDNESERAQTVKETIKYIEDTIKEEKQLKKKQK